MEVKYGQFKSERDNPEYRHVHHFFVLIERDGFHVSAGFTNYNKNYNASCHFSDVAIHYHRERGDGDKCVYSPTGFCSCYDQIRWDSFAHKISDHVAVEILIERIHEALSKNNSQLEDYEVLEIRQELKFFKLWEDMEEKYV